MNRCIVVLGMHRSGTSAISGVLKLLGFNFGRNLMGAADDNPKGFYENLRVVSLNEQILSKLNSSWDDPAFLPLSWYDDQDMESLESQIKKCLSIEYLDSAKNFALKDPRLSISLPLWNRIFNNLNIQPSYLIALRHPLEIASSLASRNSFAIQKSLLLTAKYILSAEQYTRHYPRIFVEYNQLISNPVSLKERLSSELGFPLENDCETEKQLNEFVEPNLRHYDNLTIKNEKKYPGALFDLYYLLISLAKSGKKNRETDYEDLDYYSSLIRTQSDFYYNAVAKDKEQIRNGTKNVSDTGVHKNFLKLYIDSGEGFSEGQSIAKEIASDSVSMVIDLSSYKVINRIRVDTLYYPMSITWNEVVVCFPDFSKQTLKLDIIHSDTQVGNRYLSINSTASFLTKEEKIVQPLNVQLFFKINSIDKKTVDEFVHYHNSTSDSLRLLKIQSNNTADSLRLLKIQNNTLRNTIANRVASIKELRKIDIQLTKYIWRLENKNSKLNNLSIIQQMQSNAKQNILENLQNKLTPISNANDELLARNQKLIKKGTMYETLINDPALLLVSSKAFPLKIVFKKLLKININYIKETVHRIIGRNPLCISIDKSILTNSSIELAGWTFLNLINDNIEYIEVLLNSVCIGRAEINFKREDVYIKNRHNPLSLFSGFKYDNFLVDNSLIKRFDNIVTLLVLSKNGRNDELRIPLKLEKTEVVYIENFIVSPTTIHLKGWSVFDERVEKADIYIDDSFVGYAGFDLNRKDVEEIAFGLPFTGLKFRKDIEDRCFLPLDHQIKLEMFLAGGGKYEKIVTVKTEPELTVNIDVSCLYANCYFKLSGSVTSDFPVKEIWLEMNGEKIDAASPLQLISEQGDKSVDKNKQRSGFSFGIDISQRNIIIQEQDLQIAVVFSETLIKRLSTQVENLSNSIPLAISKDLFSGRSIKQPAITESTDILIVIDNPLQDLSSFFNNLLTNTTGNYRIILVLESSSSKALSQYYLDLRDQNENIVILFNEGEKRYSSSVRQGLNISVSKTVLLSYQAKVPGNWLRRLLEPFSQEDSIRFALPFIYSEQSTNHLNLIDWFEKDSSFFTTSLIDDQLGKIDGTRLYDILPDNAFCLALHEDVVKMIKDEQINAGSEIERSFFSNSRCVLVPNLYVGRLRGDLSTPDRSTQLFNLNFGNMTSLAITANHQQIKIDATRRLLQVVLSTKQEVTEVVLIIDHGLGGGTATFRDKYMNKIVFKGGIVLLVTYMFWKKQFELKYKNNLTSITLSFESFSELLEFIAFLRLSKVVLNNLVSYPLPLNCLTIIKRIVEVAGVPLHIMVHDYYSICMSFNLLDYNDQFCRIPLIDECKKCIKRNKKDFLTEIDPDIVSWRKAWAAIYRSADVVHCFSESSMELIQKAYPFLQAGTINVTPHKVDPFEPVKIVKTNELFNIGILGNIIFQKGSDIVVDLVELIQQKYQDQINLIIIGQVYDREVSGHNLTIHGTYQRDELPDIISSYEIDMIFIPSICPETFSYTTQEAIEMDIPLATFDLGAQVEKVRPYQKGLVISRISAKYALEEMYDWYLKKRISEKENY